MKGNVTVRRKRKARRPAIAAANSQARRPTISATKRPTIWDVVIDTVGFVCKALFWSCVIFVPILATLIALWHNFLFVGLPIICFYLVLGLLLRWLGSGVLERKRLRMTLLAGLCFLFVVLSLIRKPAMEMTITYIFSFLCALCTVVLTIAILRQQKVTE
jgi:hypothetical protein